MAHQPRDPGLLILSDHLTNPYVVTTALARWGRDIDINTILKASLYFKETFFDDIQIVSCLLHSSVSKLHWQPITKIRI